MRIETRAKVAFVGGEGRSAANLLGKLDLFCILFGAWVNVYFQNPQKDALKICAFYCLDLNCLSILFICVWVFMCVLVQMFLCTHGSQKTALGVLQTPSNFILRQGLSVAWNSQSRLSCCPVSSREPSSHHHLPALRSPCPGFD